MGWRATYNVKGLRRIIKKDTKGNLHSILKSETQGLEKYWNYKIRGIDKHDIRLIKEVYTEGQEVYTDWATIHVYGSKNKINNIKNKDLQYELRKSQTDSENCQRRSY